MKPVPAGLPSAGQTWTFIVRLRHDPGRDAWRGRIICVQTGVTENISFHPDTDELLVLAGILRQFFGQSGSA